MDVLAEETVELSSSDPAKVAASLQRLIAIFNQRDPASLIVSLPSIAKVRAVSFAGMGVRPFVAQRLSQAGVRTRT